MRMRLRKLTNDGDSEEMATERLESGRRRMF